MIFVNVHEGNGYNWNPQKYVTIVLDADGILCTCHGVREWSNDSDRTIYMHRVDSRVKEA